MCTFPSNMTESSDDKNVPANCESQNGSSADPRDNPVELDSVTLDFSEPSSTADTESRRLRKRVSRGLFCGL